MKVFYKVFAATAALATLVATNTMADRYHAKSVQCRTGVSESVTTLEWLGVNEDSVEIWGAQKDNDNHAYFWCDIDGNSFSVPETNIEGNVEHTLVEIGFWEKMLLRKIPSGYNQTLFVRVKSNKSGDNKFMSFNDAEVDTFWNVDPWLLRDIEVPVKLEDSPTYDPTTNQFTQTISWEYKNFGKTVMGSL